MKVHLYTPEFTKENTYIKSWFLKKYKNRLKKKKIIYIYNKNVIKYSFYYYIDTTNYYINIIIFFL